VIICFSGDLQLMIVNFVQTPEDMDELTLSMLD